MKTPRPLFRNRPRVPHLGDVVESDPDGFRAMVLGLSSAAWDELGALPDEARQLVLWLIFARSKGHSRVHVAAKTFHLDGLIIPGDYVCRMGLLGEAVAAAWEGAVP
jgi:hypothetical protein